MKIIIKNIKDIYADYIEIDYKAMVKDLLNGSVRLEKIRSLKKWKQDDMLLYGRLNKKKIIEDIKNNKFKSSGFGIIETKNLQNKKSILRENEAILKQSNQMEFVNYLEECKFQTKEKKVIETYQYIIDVFTEMFLNNEKL